MALPMSNISKEFATKPIILTEILNELNHFLISRMNDWSPRFIGVSSNVYSGQSSPHCAGFKDVDLNIFTPELLSKKIASRGSSNSSSNNGYESKSIN